MKMRNLMLVFALLFSGAANAQERVETQVYKQEFAQVKESPSFENLFDEEVNHISHDFERKIQIYKVVPSKWQRFTCYFFLAQDAIAITPDMMPKLYTFIEDLAQKSGIPTPTIFISLHEHVFNMFAAKLLNGKGGILIEQKLLNELTDKQLEATIAHEIGHIKHNHVNKMAAFGLGTKIATFCGFLQLRKYLNPYHKYQGYSAMDFINSYVESDIATALLTALVIGKRYEKEADQFACEAGHAQGVIELMNVFDGKVKKVDSELLATNDKLAAAQSELTPGDFAELQQGLSWANMMHRFGRWIHENTPFEPHPSNTDRIAAAQAYLDANVQTPVIEKA